MNQPTLNKENIDLYKFLLKFPISNWSQLYDDPDFCDAIYNHAFVQADIIANQIIKDN